MERTGQLAMLHMHGAGWRAGGAGGGGLGFVCACRFSSTHFFLTLAGGALCSTVLEPQCGAAVGENTRECWRKVCFSEPSGRSRWKDRLITGLLALDKVA